MTDQPGTDVSWNHFSHDADIGVRGSGPSVAEAFQQAALALTAVVSPVEEIRARQRVDISVENDDVELLFVDWLNAIIYEMATRKMLFSRFKASIDHGRLTAEAWGEPVDLTRHDAAVEVKGATLTELKVLQQDDGQWIAQCIVDV